MLTMHAVCRHLAIWTCIAACAVDERPDHTLTSGSGTGSGAVTSSSAGPGSSDKSESGDLDTEGGLDLASGCDLLADPIDACGPAMACDPETLSCIPASGVGIVDAPCIDHSECAPGLACFEDRCRELCGPELPGQDQCDDARVCTVADAPLPGLCLEACELLLQVCSVAGDACNLAIGSGGAPVTVCTANPGAGVDGDACERDGDCLPAYLCTPAQLHTLACAGGAASCCTPSCDLFELVCAGIEPTCIVLGVEDQPGAGFCGP